MAKLEPYNRWLVDRFSPALGRRILEIGAGFGNLTRYLTGRELVIASDLDPVAVEYLRGTLPRRRRRSRSNRSTSRSSPRSARSSSDGRSTRSCAATSSSTSRTTGRRSRTCSRVLEPGGRLVLLVPALARLYGTLDEHLRHFRRYEKAGARGEARRRGVRARGVPLRQPAGSPRLVRERADPAPARAPAGPAAGLQACCCRSCAARRRIRRPIGMSLLAIARKPSATSSLAGPTPGAVQTRRAASAERETASAAPPSARRADRSGVSRIGCTSRRTRPPRGAARSRSDSSVKSAAESGPAANQPGMRRDLRGERGDGARSWPRSAARRAGR